MSDWVAIPNGPAGEGFMFINLDNVETFYDLGSVTFDGESQPTDRINVIFINGNKRVLNMTALEFSKLTVFTPVRVSNENV